MRLLGLSTRQCRPQRPVALSKVRYLLVATPTSGNQQKSSAIVGSGTEQMFDAGFQIADRERKAIPRLHSLLANPDIFEARLNFSDFEDDLGDLDSFRDFHSKVSFASGPSTGRSGLYVIDLSGASTSTYVMASGGPSLPVACYSATQQARPIGK